MHSLLALLLAAPATAADPVHVDVFAATYFPVSVGVAGRVELPARVRLTVGVGTMPGAYLSAINGLCTGFGWYDDLTASLISSALKNSLIVHPRVGWRPSPKLGFHFDVGYQVAALGGSLSGAETIAAASGQELPDGFDGDVIEVDASATDHMLTIEAGYDIVVRERLVIDLSLGGAFSVAARSELARAGEITTPSRFDDTIDERLDPLLAQGEEYLTDTLTRYVHTPTVGVMVGYRFR